MRHNDILNYLSELAKYNLADRVNDIVRDILPNLNDVDYGKRFISKKEFLRDFNHWLDTTFIDDEYNFGLNISIPDDGIVSVKSFHIRWAHPITGDVNLYYIWAVQIYKDLPVLQIEDRAKKVFGLSKVATDLSYSDDYDEYSNVVNVGVILYGDKSSCGDRLGHIIKHEIVHFVLNCLKRDARLPSYVDHDDDEFTCADIDELIADIVPYYISWLDWDEPERTDRVLDLFKRDLFVKFNPEASSLYNNIIEYLLSGGIL